jgi:hypothetical protein
LIAIFLITIFYTLVVIWLGSIPRASDFFGHSLGIIGFVMMVMTETLYTFRKRSRSARWGRMSIWLQFHIFTGIVGPYMVLLHTSWKFNGLAGVLTFLTLVTVLSGFIGRYIYTALPRSADGPVLGSQELNSIAIELEKKIEQIMGQRWQTFPTPPGRKTSSNKDTNPLQIIFGRTIDDMIFRFQWRQYRTKLPSDLQGLTRQLEFLIYRQQQVQREMISATMARRLMALWHTVHIPIGMALFALSAVHIIAAIYYATLLR